MPISFFLCGMVLLLHAPCEYCSCYTRIGPSVINGLAQDAIKFPLFQLFLVMTNGVDV